MAVRARKAIEMYLAVLLLLMVTVQTAIIDSRSLGNWNPRGIKRSPGPMAAPQSEPDQNATITGTQTITSSSSSSVIPITSTSSTLAPTPTSNLCPVVEEGFDDLEMAGHDTGMESYYKDFNFPGIIDWALQSTEYIGNPPGTNAIASHPNALFSPAHGNFVSIYFPPSSTSTSFDLVSITISSWSRSSQIPVSDTKLQFHFIAQKANGVSYPMVKILDMSNLAREAGQAGAVPRVLGAAELGEIKGLRMVSMAGWWISSDGKRRVATEFLVDDLVYKKRLC